MKRKPLNFLTTAAVIAALYTAITLIAAPFSFGSVQIRLSEALTVLPAIFPPAVLGLSAGCVLSNLIGFLMGANPLGFIDCAVGSAATLIAASLTCFIGKRFKGRLLFVLAPLPAVVINAIFVGTELAVIILGKAQPAVILISALYVALGEIIPCYLGGALILRLGKDNLEKFINSK